jgi:alkylated DNA repair dioxygenase AlkB
MTTLETKTAFFDPDSIQSPLIEAIDWQAPPAEAIMVIRDAFMQMPVEELRRVVVDRRNGLDPRQALILEAGSAERPLMLKHLLALGNIGTQQYKIWANEYRATAWEEEGGNRHVERYHNHRFHLVSRMLQGGYTAEECVYDTDTMPADSMTDSQADVWGAAKQGLRHQSSLYREGDLMSLHSDEIHRLRNILPGTISLIVETPRVRNFGIVFDEAANTPQIIFPDMGHSYAALTERLNAPASV